MSDLLRPQPPPTRPSCGRVVAALAVGWGSRHSLRRGHPQHPDAVRIGTLAAWPTDSGAGLAVLIPILCRLADDQEVILDLTARTPRLMDRYAEHGFTRPIADKMWMIRHPHPSPNGRAGGPGVGHAG